MATKKRSSRHHGSAKGRVIGHVRRSPGTFCWVTGGGTVREMKPPKRSSRRHGDKRKGSRRSRSSRRR